MPLIQIHIARGRTAEQKRELLDAVTRATQETLGAPLESIRVWIQEFDADDYMAGGELLSERRRRRNG